MRMALRTSSIVCAPASRAASEAFLQDVEYLRDVLLKLCAAYADRVEDTVEDIVEELFALHVADAAFRVGRLQFIEVLELRPEISKILIGGECVEVCEDRVALHVAGVGDIQVSRVGIHALDLLPYGVFVVGEVYAVAETLRHLLLSVGLTGRRRAVAFSGSIISRLHEHR